MGKWLEWLWMNYQWRAVGTAIGFFFGLVFLLVGFWKMIIFFCLMMIGFVIGMQVDGRIDLREWMDAWFFDRWMRK